MVLFIIILTFRYVHTSNIFTTKFDFYLQMHFYHYYPRSIIHIQIIWEKNTISHCRCIW